MAANYQVVAQRQTVDLGADGRFTDVIEVTYQTASGVTGSVRVPVATFTPDRVAELIDARAVQHDAVANL